VFRGYDVRGVYGSEVTPEKFQALGRALLQFSKKLIIGMDYRKPNPELFSAIASSFGGEIRAIGNCPTACVSFNTRQYGVMLTASHNPAQYAGAKFIHERHGFFEAELKKLEGEFEKELATPSISKPAKVEPAPELLEKYEEDIPEITKGIFDLGGGAACAVKRLFPTTIFDEPDPLFKKRAPEPKEESLGELKKKTVEEKQTGFAFDGDADRVMVAAQGKVIPGPHVTAFLCSQNFKKGDTIVLNIEFSQETVDFVRDELGMKVVTCPVGTKYVVTNVLEKRAAMGAEPNGHYYIPKHAPDSDGIYSAALLSRATPKELVEFSSQFKNTVVSEAVLLKCDFGKLCQCASKNATDVNTMDGVRAVYDDYVVLMRASQTEPKVRITVEAKTPQKAKAGLEKSKKLVQDCSG